MAKVLLKTRAAATDERRRKVLAAALECFETLGYEATTIDDIRARSGASTGSIYHHFESKEGVAAALYVEALERYRKGFRAHVESARTARSLIRGIVQYHLDWALENPSWAKYLLHMRRAESVKAIDATLRESTAAFVRDVGEHLRQWVERGELVALPYPLYAPLVIGPAQEVLRQWASGRKIDLSAARDPLADAAWRALRA